MASALMIAAVNGHDFELELADNASALSLANLVAHEGIQIRMQDYGGFEKVGLLPQSLPTNDEQIATEPGDIILYQGDKLVIYYDTNSWRFTRLGKVVGTDAALLREVLGSGDVTVTLRRS